MSLYSAEVIEVLPEKGGIRVRFADLVRSGFGDSDFVRVLQTRMHESGGAALWLPEKGEFGIVGSTEGGNFIWLGSLPYQNKNQVDPAPGLLYVRHQSGVVVQIRKNGDFEVAHPSGCRITMGEKSGALPELQATSSPEHLGYTGAPMVEVVHPTGASFSINQGGKVEISAPLITLKGTVKFEAGFGSDAAAKGSTFTTPTGDVVTIQGGLVTGVVPAGGTELLNDKYFDDLIDSIDSVNRSEELQELVDAAAASLSGVKAGIAAQLSKVNPWLSLLSPPSSPTDVVTWVGNFISGYLQPQTAPATTLPLQTAALTAKTAQVGAAVSRAQSRIPNCSVTMPTI